MFHIRARRHVCLDNSALVTGEEWCSRGACLLLLVFTTCLTQAGQRHSFDQMQLLGCFLGTGGLWPNCWFYGLLVLVKLATYGSTWVAWWLVVMHTCSAPLVMQPFPKGEGQMEASPGMGGRQRSPVVLLYWYPG